MDRPKVDRSKVIAVVTGAIALFLGIAYLVLVQVLDSRGEMLPAPTDLSTQPQAIVAIGSYSSAPNIGLGGSLL